MSGQSVWNSKEQKSYNNFLYPTQQEVLHQSNRNQILELGTSSGKTFIGLHVYAKYSTQPLLIVAPRAKVDEKGWDKSIHHFQKNYNTNFEWEITTPDLLKKNIEKYKGYYVIFDECHYVKNSTSQRGKNALKMINQSDGFLLLSATPMSNGWEDSINYFKMFGYTKNKTQFEREFALKEQVQFGHGRPFMKIVGWRRERQLKEWWNNISIQKPTSYFVDLPEKEEVFVDFKVNPFYKRFDKERIIKWSEENIELLDNLPKLNVARRKYGNEKAKQQHLEMVIDTKENVLIFYNFDSEREHILKVAKKLDKKVFEVSGHKKNIPLENEWSELENTITLVQYRAGGAGVELQYNSVMVIYSPTYSYQDHVQALGRAHRHGGKRLMIYKYRVNDTIEDAVYNVLSQKKDFTDDLYQ